MGYREAEAAQARAAKEKRAKRHVNSAYILKIAEAAEIWVGELLTALKL
jgi:hypothetical protein